MKLHFNALHFKIHISPDYNYVPVDSSTDIGSDYRRLSTIADITKCILNDEPCTDIFKTNQSLSKSCSHFSRWLVSAGDLGLRH